jgi:hypothetical protein
VVVASVAEAEYAAAFGDGQVLVELTLLTNLGHPISTVTHLPFVAISLATSSVRPKKSKSIDMRLDWMKERSCQQFFRLVFLPGLINPTDFFTKILPVYRHIAALPLSSRHPIPYTFCPTHLPITTHPQHQSSGRDAILDRDQPTLPPLTLVFKVFQIFLASCFLPEFSLIN